MNHFAYYALKCEGGDFASCDPVESCSFAGSGTFTFGMDFYWSGQAGTLFRQEGSVCCRICEDELHWEGMGWEVATSALTMPLIADGWNHIDVVYEEKRVLLYLNGIEASEAALSGQAQAGSTKYYFLEDYTGYLRNVRIVDHSMTQEEIAGNLLETKIQQENLWLWLPFDAPYAQDRGKYQKKVSYPGLCRCESLVTALCFSGKGYALLDQAVQNPGNAQLPSFSVAMRFFSIPCGSDSALLFENSGNGDGFQICLKEKQSKLALVWGKEQSVLDTPTIPYYAWTDLIVSVGQREIQIYLNGAAAATIPLSAAYSRTSSPRLCLGDGFTGYMDYFALYDQALTLKSASQIHAMEPYVFDTGISLLYLFHGEPRQNFLGSGTLLLQEGAQLKIAEGTIYEETIEPIRFRSCNTFSIGAFAQWEADILADIGGKFSVTATGQGSCVLEPGTMEFLWNGLKDSAAAQNLFLDYQAITETEILSLMKTAASQEVTLSVLTSMVSQGAALGVATVNMEKVMDFQLALGTALGLSFLLKVATDTKTKAKQPDPPPAPDPEPQPETGYAVELLSIQFCNGKEGSLPLREDYHQNQTLPEWSSASAGEAVCAYAAGKQSPKVKLSFRYIPAKDQPPVSIRLGFRSGILGDCLSDAKTCGSTGVYEVEAICDKNQLEKAHMGKTAEALRCYYQDTGRNHMLRTADVNVHILCRKPCAPWSAENQDQAPLIPLLQFAAEMASVSSAKIENEETYLNAAADWLGGKTDCSLQAAEKYSTHNIGKAPFCAEQFVRDFRKSGLTAGFLDYYLFTAYMGAMEGLTVYVYELSAMERRQRGKNGTYGIRSAGVCMDEACRIFGKACPEEFRKCYLVSTQKAKNTVYWDLLTRKADMPSSWKKAAWKDYRDQVISWASFVYDPAPLEGWTEVGEIPKQPLTITFDPDTAYFVGDGRWEFKPYIKERFSYPKNKACCHRVSYHTIEEILTYTFNAFGEDKISKGAKDTVLNLLLKGFYPNGRPDKLLFEGEYQNYTELTKTLGILKRTTAAGLKNPATCEKTGRYLDTVLNCLNSATGNLRDGYGQWNSSIGEAFDPASWFAVLTVDGTNYKVIDQNGLCDPQEAESFDQGVYLDNRRDGQLLHMLKQIQAQTEREFLEFDYPVYSQWTGNEFVYYPAVRSSSNEFLLECLNSETIVVPYCYMNPETGEWSEI